MTDLVDDSGGASRTLTPDAILPSAAERALGSNSSPPGSPAGEEKVMTLVEHLSELRRRLFISILAVVIGTAIGWFFTPQLIVLLLDPLPSHRVIFLTVTGGFMVYFKIALVVGILLSLPIILYQLWAFVSPGLTTRERRAALPWLPLTVVFFLAGTGVAYFTLPFAIAFLLSFQIPGVLDPDTTAEAYFGFVTTVFLVFGGVMEFPIVLVMLSKMGILNVEKLRASRRYVLLGIVIFAVVITPGGDPYSPTVMSAVMYLLFEVTIFLLRNSSPKTDASSMNDA